MYQPRGDLKDVPFQVETYGINPIQQVDRHGRARDLFWLWFAGNMSFTYIVIGAVVWSYGLSLWQSVLAITLGLASFVVIGYLGLPGHATGLPTMAYAERIFGRYGNRAVSAVSWLNMVGWETVVLIIASFTIAAILNLLFGLALSPVSLILSLALAAGLELSFAFLGHATIELLQRWASYIFGLLTLGVLLALLPHVHWVSVWHHPAGSWMTAMIPAITVVVAVSALSWVTTAADYTRYLPTSIPKRRIVWSASVGGIIPTALLMFAGLLLGNTASGLASASNPVAFLLHWLPAWAQIPYLLITVVGIVAGGVLCAYSSGLSLLAAGVKLPRSRTIGFDALISLAASLYVLLVSQGFLGNFEAFLSLVAALLAPFVGVALFHLRPERMVSHKVALASWLGGAILGLATTATPIFTGPLAIGIFQQSSLGYFAGFALSVLMYAIWMSRSKRKQTPNTSHLIT